MASNHIVKVVVTKEQHEKIKQMARDRGKTMSSFLKEIAFMQNFPLERMIKEIHTKILEVN